MTNEWRRARTPDELRERFPAMDYMRPMDPMASTQVRAALRAEDIIRRVWGDNPAAVLFDPARVSELAERADAAADDFHLRADEFHYDTADTDYDRHEPAEQGVVRIWRVGTNHVHVVRDRWHDSPNRRFTTAGYAATELGLERSMYDHWGCTEHGCDAVGCGSECTVGLAKACGGTTRLMPVDRGTLILLFRCCQVCEELAGSIAANAHKTNWKLAEIEARDFGPV